MSPNAGHLIRGLRDPDQRGVGRTVQVDSGLDSLHRLIELEVAAKTIQAVDLQFIPGLLQTSQYSKALVHASHPSLAGAEIGRRAMLKATRQQVFAFRALGDPSKPPNVKAHFVLGEVSIISCIRSELEVHHAQLSYLLELAQQGHLTMQILPMGKVPPGCASHFTLYTLEGEEDGETMRHQVGFMETIMGDYYSTRENDVRRLESAHAELAREAMSPAESGLFVEEVLLSWQPS